MKQSSYVFFEILPDYIFNKKYPIILGVKILKGIAKVQML